MSLDVFAYLEQLSHERYRTMILHAAPDKGLALTRFVQRIAERNGGKYFDLLEYFVQSAQLSSRIDSYRLENLKDLLIDQSRGARLLILDRPDFLLDTWTPPERQSFFRLLANQWDGFRDTTRSILLIAMQTSIEMQQVSLLDAQGQSRIFQLDDFNDIL